MNTPAELAVELKNQHPDGGAEPRVEWGAGGVEGAGVYRLAYGVRVQGTFLLSIKLMGQDVLERLVTVRVRARARVRVRVRSGLGLGSR